MQITDRATDGVTPNPILADKILFRKPATYSGYLIRQKRFRGRFREKCLVSVRIQEGAHLNAI